MIITKGPEPNDIIAFRLTTGEEVIGRLQEITDKSVSVTKPIIANLRMMNSGEAAISFTPFMVAPEETAKFTVLLSAIATKPMLARADIQQSYVKMTTGIEVAPASSLLKA